MRHYRLEKDLVDHSLNIDNHNRAKAEQVFDARPNTHGKAQIAIETLQEFAKERSGRVSLNEVSSSKHALLALYEMKNREFVQEHNGDDATLQVLRTIPMAYQVDILVQKYKSGSFDYPTTDVIWHIMSEMEDEAVFGPGTDRLD